MPTIRHLRRIGGILRAHLAGREHTLGLIVSTRSAKRGAR